MFVKPKDPETLVPDPRTGRRLPADGARVPRTTYWQRRLRDGSVVEAEPPSAPPSKSTKRSSAAKEA